MNQKLQPSSSWLAYEPVDQVLREVAQDVTLPLSPENEDLVKRMIAYVDASFKGKASKYDIVPGIAIAAPQLHAPVNIIYIHFTEIVRGEPVEHLYLLANPKIISHSLTQAYLDTGEGCLSVKNHHNGYVYRSKKIIVQAYDLINQQKVVLSMDGLLSICCQHEIDHLNGKLYFDHINQENPFEKKKGAIEIGRNYER